MPKGKVKEENKLEAKIDAVFSLLENLLGAAPSVPVSVAPPTYVPPFPDFELGSTNLSPSQAAASAFGASFMGRTDADNSEWRNQENIMAKIGTLEAQVETIINWIRNASKR